MRAPRRDSPRACTRVRHGRIPSSCGCSACIHAIRHVARPRRARHSRRACARSHPTQWTCHGSCSGAAHTDREDAMCALATTERSRDDGRARQTRRPRRVRSNSGGSAARPTTCAASRSKRPSATRSDSNSIRTRAAAPPAESRSARRVRRPHRIRAARARVAAHRRTSAHTRRSAHDAD